MRRLLALHSESSRPIALAPPRSSVAPFAACAVALLVFGAAGPAEAQFYTDYGFYGFGSPSGKIKKKPRSKQTARPTSPTREVEAARDAEPKVEPAGPLVLNVSLNRQRVAIYDQNGLVSEAPISSGRVGHPTPTGIFSVLEKRRMHYSNLYDSAPMPNMLRITWSGVALHAGILPGYPASHGCIRLPHGFSKRLFEMAKTGTRVIVSRDPIAPQPFEDNRLFQYHPETPDTQAALPVSPTRVADATESGAIRDVLGVNEAKAAEADETGLRQRVTLIRAARQQEERLLNEAITAAETAKKAATEDAKAAVAAAAEAQKRLRAARIAWNGASGKEKALRGAQAQAEKRLESFAKQVLKRSSFTEKQAEDLQKEEDALETKVLDLADQVAQASGDAKSASNAFAAAEVEAGKAHETRQAALAKMADATAAHKKAVEELALAKKRASKHSMPVHVFISRKTGKIYARQGYLPILEAPVQIEAPDQPLGTHVLTALAVGKDNSSMTWSVVSVPTAPSSKVASAKNKKARELALAEERAQAAAAREAQTADRALARISFSDDVRAQIEDVMKPGSSLIISDNGASNETGKYTDFIVSIR